MFGKILEKWKAYRLAQQFNHAANKYLTPSEQHVLKSTWGLSRLQQLSRDYNSGERKNDMFHPVRLNSFEDVISCFQKDDYFNNDEWASMLACPGRTRTMTGMGFIRTVLFEGREKSEEELARPVLREVSAQDKTLIGNPGWQKFQERLAAYNAGVTRPSDKIEVSDLEELTEYRFIAESPVGADAEEHIPALKRARVVADLFEAAKSEIEAEEKVIPLHPK